MAIDPTYPVETHDIADGFASFVPTRLAAYLAKPVVEPTQTRLSGAVVFADIVGFTALTERFAHSGEEGLEKLSEVLNTTFANYVEEVRRSGGEVAVFAGDAFLAYWVAKTPGENELVRAARAAAACAVRLLDVRYENSREHGAPELHVGLAAGSLWAARVGSTALGWELVLGGDAVRDAAAALGLSERGQISVAASAASLLGPTSVARSESRWVLRREPFAAPNDIALHNGTSLQDADGPTITLPRIVRERWSQRANAWLAELRSVTPVFVRIDGFDDMGPDALDSLQRVWKTLQDVVHGFSSERGSLLIDDKGLVFLLVFGTAYNTHADDGVRAVRMALAIEHQIGRLGFRCAMGVASGAAFCGVLGSKARCMYATVGPPMNRAARLMMASGSGLMCQDLGDETLLLPDLSVSSAGVAHLKGLDAELALLRIQSRLRIAHALGDLCGRTAEQLLLDRLLDDLACGQGGLVTIVGDAGVGKSALALDALERARQRGIRGALGQCEHEAKVSYGAWRGVLPTILGLGGDPLGGGLEDAARRGLSRCERAELFPLLAPLLSLPANDTKHTGQLRDAARADATLQLLTDVMRELAPAPMVVVLEDVHWMDSASWRLLERVTSLVPGLLVIVTSRSANAPGLKEATQNAARCQEIALRPLDKEARLTLVRKLLGERPPPTELLRLVEDESAGNPLYIVECVLLLSDALGRARRGDVGAPEEPVHSSVRALITSRLDLLSPRQELAIKVASVAGSTFHWSLVERLLGAMATQSSDLSGVLVRQRLIAEVPDAPGVFRFSHEMIRDVAYGLMLVQQRRSLHRDAALAIEEDASRPKPAATLANHWLLDSDQERMLLWSDRAGTEALETGAFEEATHHFNRCLQAVQDRRATATRELRLRWDRKISDAYMGLGNLAARDEHARAGLALAGERPNALGSTTRLHAFGTLVFGALRPRLPYPEEECLEIAALYRHVAHVAYFESDGPGLFVATLRAVRAAERCAPSPALCGALAELGGALGLGGTHTLALRYLERAVRTAEGIDHPHGLAYVHMVRSLYLVGRGQWEEALMSVDRCQDICNAIRDSVTWGNAQIVRFWVAYYRGHLSSAESAGTALLSRAERMGNRQHEAWALRGLAVLRLLRGDAAGALPQLETARRHLPPADTTESMATLALLSLCHWYLHDETQARHLQDEATALAEKIGRPTGHATLAGLLAVAKLAFVTYDGSPAGRASMARAIERLDRYRRVFPIGIPFYWKWRGLWAQREGQARAARTLIARGRRDASRLGIALEHDFMSNEPSRKVM